MAIKVNIMKMVWMKFLYWREDLAYFRKATRWEIIRMKVRDIFTTTPDPNNLLLYVEEGWSKSKQPYKYNEVQYATK